MEHKEANLIEKFVKRLLECGDFKARKMYNEKEVATVIDKKGRKMTFYIKETKKIREKNKNLSLLYKFTDTRGSEFIGFLYYFGNTYYDICANLKSSFNKNDINRYRLFGFYLTNGEPENNMEKKFEKYKSEIGDDPINLYKCESISFLKETIGEEIYQDIVNFFLKENNLLLKNSIYKIY